MSKRETAAVIGIVLVLLIVFTALTPGGRENWNNWIFQLHKADDATSYQTRKEVEDSCRAMQASYEADRLTYTQYAQGTPEERKWAAAARTRANKTAAVYNQYVLKNSFVWEGNVPRDILTELEYIEEEGTD